VAKQILVAGRLVLLLEDGLRALPIHPSATGRCPLH
jgi:hypothetical protein